MNRRSFLGKVFGAVAAAVAVALPKPKADHYKVEWGSQFGTAGHSPEAMAEIIAADKIARGDPGGRWIRMDGTRTEEPAGSVYDIIDWPTYGEPRKWSFSFNS